MRNTKIYNVLMTLILSSVLVISIVSLPLGVGSIINNVNIKNSGKIVLILPLHVEGRYIKDVYGNIILLKGVNQPGMLDDPNGWWNPEGGNLYSGLGVWNPDAVKYNLDKMKEWGCNALRLHTAIRWWLEDTENYRQHIKDIITWAGERGIYVIFEPYSVEGGVLYELPWGEYLPEEQRQVMPNSEAFIDYWITVVNELKQFPNVLFEIYNEPHGDQTAKEEFFEVAQQWINAIREAGADQILIVQWGYGIWCNLAFPPPNDSATLSWVEEYPLTDPLGNIVYSFHNYRGDFHRSSPQWENVWKYEDIKQALQLCLVDYVLFNLSKPVIVGEIGANMYQTGDELQRELAYFNNSLTIYNEWNMSYIAWVWDCPAHLQHGLLENGYDWCPPPNAAGVIFISKIRE